MTAPYAQSSSQRLPRLLLAALAFACAAFGPARAAPDAADLLQAELLIEPTTIRPAEPFLVGIRLTMKEHWHTYQDVEKGSSLGPASVIPSC